MRKIVTTLILVFAALCGSAQLPAISGKVLDANDNTPLIGVSVVAIPKTDTNQKIGTATDVDGAFSIQAASGSYTLRVSYIGYQPYSRAINLGDAGLATGNISLSPGTNTLNTVVVQGQQVRAQQNGDTISFNANAFKTNPDASTEDLVSKMPGVTNTNGTLQVNGEDVKRVLIDGKPFYGDDPSAALKNLPAEVVDKIQVLDQQSDQSRFTGFDDGNAVKTINIVTRPGRNQGVFGKIIGGYGTDENATDGRYLGSANINFFKGSRRISLIGLSNNINQQNFSGDDFLGTGGGGGGGNRGGRGGGGNGGGGSSSSLVGQSAGITQTHAAGLNYTDEWGPKVKVTGSYFYNKSNTTANTDLTRSYVGNTSEDSALTYTEKSTSNSLNENHRANLRLEYSIDSNNEFIAVPRLSYQNSESRTASNGFTTTRGGFGRDTTIIFNLANNSGYNFNNEMTFRHRFGKRGRTISIGATTGYNDRDGDGLRQNQSADTSLDQRYFQESKTLNLSGNVSYTEPLGQRSQLLLSYQPSYTNNNSDIYTYSRPNPASDVYNNLDTTVSNVYDNSYTSHRAGAGYRYSDSARELDLTLNAQQATLDGTQVFPYALDINKSWFNLLPQLRFNYKFSKSENIRIGYRTSTNTPSITQLQSVVNNSNPLRLSTGNPDLQQDYTHRLFARYGRTNVSSGTSLFGFATFSYVNNYVGNATVTALRNDTTIGDFILPRGGQFTRPVNLDGNWSARGFFTFSMPLKKLKTNLNTNTGLNLNSVPSLINGASNRADNYGFSQGFSFSSNISENVDFTISANGTYTIVKNSLQTQNNNNYNYYSQNSSARLNWIFLKGFVFNTDLTHTLYSGLGEGYDQNYFLWNASIGHKFLKDRSLQADIYAFDILRQNRSVSRANNDSYIENSTTQVLQRFLMLRLTYTIRKYTGNQPRGFNPEDDGERRRGNWPGGGMGRPPGGSRGYPGGGFGG